MVFLICYRLMVEDAGLQLDFMTTVHGIRSFESLRARATTVTFGEYKLLVASLEDVVKSKRLANRARDRAVREVLERTLHEKKRQEKEGLGRVTPGK